VINVTQGGQYGV